MLTVEERLVLRIPQVLGFYLSVAILACIGCGGDSPLVENPGQAIIVRMLPPITVAVGESLELRVNTTHPDRDKFSYEWTARNGRSLY